MLTFIVFYENETDKPTDGPTDRPTYRDARAHLKLQGSSEYKMRRLGMIEVIFDKLPLSQNMGVSGDILEYRDFSLKTTYFPKFIIFKTFNNSFSP